MVRERRGNVRLSLSRRLRRGKPAPLVSERPASLLVQLSRRPRSRMAATLESRRDAPIELRHSRRTALRPPRRHGLHRERGRDPNNRRVAVRRATLALVLPILAMSACRNAHDGESDLPYYRSAAMTPEWLSAAEADAPDTHRVAPFHMSDQNGRAVTEGAFAGRVTVVHFF